MKEKINVTRSSIPDIEEYIEEIRPLWDSRWLTNAGALHNQLKAELKKRAGVPELLLFCNGHLALEAAFSLFPPGSEVITTPFTYISTTLAIIRAGLIPVFCDIEPIYYTLDPKKIESLITEKTVAVVPVHVYGNICDCAGIQEVADRHQLKVIYDAAHAFGETYNGADIGSLGDISMFSFHATKVFNTIEGGCLCLRDPELSQQLTVWKHFGTMGGDNLVLNGTNAKMTEFAAAMGLCNLRHISEWIEMRKKATQRYRDRLGNVPGLILCPPQDNTVSNYAYMPIRILPDEFGKDRERVLSELNSENIFPRRYFFPLTSDTDYCRKHFMVQLTPVASLVASQILCLPLYAELTEDDVDRICDTILKRTE